MIVLFQGGGPAQGLFKNFNNDKGEIRVATAEMLADGVAAVYQITMREKGLASFLRMQAVAQFIGIKPSAESLVDLVVEQGEN